MTYLSNNEEFSEHKVVHYDGSLASLQKLKSTFTDYEFLLNKISLDNVPFKHEHENVKYLLQCIKRSSHYETYTLQTNMYVLNMHEFFAAEAKQLNYINELVIVDADELKNILECYKLNKTKKLNK